MTRRGVYLPAFDALADAAVVARLAADAEAAGWDGFFLWDHTVYAAPVTALADPWTCLAAAAVATSSIRLGALVTPLSRRRVLNLARTAATLDRLSGGRLVLGAGLGDDGSAREMSRLGEEASARVRAAMLDESLAVLTALLAGERVDHDGPHVTVRDVVLAPRPAAPVPLWVGARWPNQRPLRRAARFDGAFVIGLTSPDEVRALRDSLPPTCAVVVELPVGESKAAWSAAGVDWLLTRYGPYEMDLAAIEAAVRAGP